MINKFINHNEYYNKQTQERAYKRFFKLKPKYKDFKTGFKLTGCFRCTLPDLSQILIFHRKGKYIEFSKWN